MTGADTFLPAERLARVVQALADLESRATSSTLAVEGEIDTRLYVARLPVASHAGVNFVSRDVGIIVHGDPRTLVAELGRLSRDPSFGAFVVVGTGALVGRLRGKTSINGKPLASIALRADIAPLRREVAS